MRTFIYLLTLAVAAYHVWTRRIPSLRRLAAYGAAAVAIAAFWAGFRVAMTEDALGRYGRVVRGTVSEKISTTGEQGSRRIGKKYLAIVVTSEGTDFCDALQRLVATGLSDAWAVSYTYPCESAQPCLQRTFISHDRWKQLRTGDTVNVRYVSGALGGARLDDEPQWATAIARMAIGVALMAAAVLIAGAESEVDETDLAGLRRPA